MKKTYTISSTGIDSYLWDVRVKTRETLGIDRGDMALNPLVYYIGTGRASSAFLRCLFKVSPTRIARLLMGGGSDTLILDRIKQAIKYRDSLL